MSRGEFNLIDAYFLKRGSERRDIVLGIGDDCALVQAPADHEIAVTTDTMVAGVHFDEKTPARAIGHKIAAVNLSDLAAMGAEPSWLSLAITLPQQDDEWLAEFAAGLHEICRYYQCSLIGGDTTRGPLSVTITAQGLIPKGRALLRSGAKAGDWIYVSDKLGDAGLALAAEQDQIGLDDRHYQAVLERLHYPRPQVALGLALRGIASAAIDISDGLLADLRHILKASQVGAKLTLDELPLSLALTESLTADAALTTALTAGDDYELCFTVPDERQGMLETALLHTAIKPVCIGRITAASEQVELWFEEKPWDTPEASGFDHFKDSNR